MACQSGRLRKGIGACSAKAEADAGSRRRIDLIAWIETHEGERFGAVVEAKFGHHLTAKQLKSYEAASAERFKLDPAKTAFAVVASSFTKATSQELRDHPRWRFLSWQRLITYLDAALAMAGADDPDFARFRRTIWHRAGS